MEIRKIKPEEKVAASLLQDMVYLSEGPEDYAKQLQNPLEHSEGYENIWAGFDGTGKMCSVTGVFDYRVRFDGHMADMGGIGGVATLAEARNAGYVRETFAKILPVMREEGKVFSYLYPFSFGFYRKFGYELCYAPARATIPMDFFREYPFPGGMTQYHPGGDIAPLMAVYEAFIRDKNLPIVRDTEAMREWADKDPYRTKHYAYLHRDGHGSPDAYLLFRVDEEDGDRILHVRELAWVSPGGLRAVFGFIGGLGPEFETLRWDAPRGIDLPALFKDGFDIKIQITPYGMNRIVDVRRALELMRAPKQPGRAVIRVTDTALPSNDGTYAVEWENGAVSSVKPSGLEPDLDTDIQTLTQLVTGYLTVDQAKLKRGVAVLGGEATLRALFVHKELYIAEFF
ncbi:MAG: GNAT family N-acetyltransferase [Oscillospiraceae bacterium]|jgi:predicted acetyltransferase|nr:GNAT family N-acetyltransferase [Oscillospiraceae bacterium]